MSETRDSQAVEKSVVEKGEVLQMLGDLQAFYREYGQLLNQVWDHDKPAENGLGLLEKHQQAVRDGTAVPLRAGVVLVLLRYLLSHMKQETITFRLASEGLDLPAEDHPEFSELSEFLRSLNAPLETWGRRIYEAARTSQAASSNRSHMVLGPIASLLKAIMRQDWEDTDLVLNHINVVTTSRQSHELVDHVAKLIRTIYNSLNELSQDYTIESLSHTTQELPDAVDKLNSVILELEDSANRNLDLLEVLNGLVNEDQQKIADALKVLEEAESELDALAAERPDLAEPLGEARTHLREGIATRLAGCRSSLEQSFDIYMTLFANQSYQDLTGQTLKKVIAFIEGLQYQLIQVITKQTHAPAPGETEPRAPIEEEQGPDAVNRLSQDKVDTLLAELGF